MCLFPKLMRPFEPIIQSFKCKLGLNEDGFMENPPCNESTCLNPEIEDRPITRDRGLPNLDFMIEDMVSTMDDCFNDMTKLVYGSRVLIKAVDDESCDDSRYSDTCKELLEEDRVIMEDSCTSPRYEHINEFTFHAKLKINGYSTAESSTFCVCMSATLFSLFIDCKRTCRTAGYDATWIPWAPWVQGPGPTPTHGTPLPSQVLN